MDDFVKPSELPEKTNEEKVKSVKKVLEDKDEFNPMELLDNPLVKSLMSSGKDLFKKEKVDPDVCEINIKAPSEVVLKLFRVFE